MAHCDSAVARTPIEIWFTILDHVIDAPEYFDATCEGSFLDFWQSSKNSDPFFQSLVHLKKIKKVCRSWERFALERAHRLVDVAVPLRHPIEVVRRARAANIKGCNYDALKCHTLWRRVTIAIGTRDQAIALTHLAENSSRHPYLRRIYITHELHNMEYLASLSYFVHITLLSLALLTISPHLHKRVTLARVEVLIWEAWWDDLNPSTLLHLPSLRHLALIGTHSDPVSLATAFKDTLVSLYIDESFPISRYQVSGLVGFPKLEEFATNGCIDATDFPSSRTLPTLARMYLDSNIDRNIGGIKTMLASGLHGSFTLRAGFSWGIDGRVDHLWDMVSQSDLDDIVKSCEKQGITFVDSAGHMCPVKRVG